MAITNIHAITKTVSKSLDYITDSSKTNDKSLLTYIGCTPATAAIQFEYANNRAERTGKNKAFHIVQAFAPGEVDEETAHKIGVELANRHLNSRYSFVVATHNDKDHIHNHIIFCATDNINHLKYHDCKKTYYELRNISDALCKEYGLSVIKNQKSYSKNNNKYNNYENSKNENTADNNQNNSSSYDNNNDNHSKNNSNKRSVNWKQQLKKDIKKCLKFCPSYEVFLQRMKNLGYEIKNEYPEDGKYICFKPPGCSKWIRGRNTTLGDEYTRESIMAEIERYAYEHDSKTSKNFDDYLIKWSDKVIVSINKEKIENSENVGFKYWANKYNFKALTHNYALMTNNGFESFNDLKDKLDELKEQEQEHLSNAAAIDNELIKTSECINALEQFNEYRNIYILYEKSKDKEAFLQNHEYELLLYFGAERILKENGFNLKSIDPDTLNKLKEEYLELLKAKNEELSKADEKNKEYEDLETLYKEFEEIMLDPNMNRKQHKKHEHNNR